MNGLSTAMKKGGVSVSQAKDRRFGPSVARGAL